MLVRSQMAAPIYMMKGYTMSSLIESAREFALKAHGDQEHGCLSIKDHLLAVTEKIAAEYHNTPIDNPFTIEQAVAVGWLHDTMEDTYVEYNDIRNAFGILIADAVNAVTDGAGKNRTERHLNTYWRTRKNTLATFVKLADRWHNQKRSLENKERFASMYAREYTYFKFALYEPGYLGNFWAELDQQYEQLKKI